MSSLLSRCLCMLAVAWASAAAVGPRAASSHVQALPVDVIIPFVPHSVAAEGKRHLVYELHLTNFGRAELHLQRIEAVDGVSGRTLMSLSGEQLASAISRRGVAAGGDRLALGAGQRSIVFVDVMVPVSQPAPSVIRHRITFAPFQTIDLKNESTLETDPIHVSPARPFVLGPPLRGGCWVASHALSNDADHRRTIIALNGHAFVAQRFAIDWIRIGADGQAFRANPADNRNWSAYGADVLAVADGTVLEARDGIPENDPTSDKKAVPIDLETVGGNHVLLRIGNGGSVFYAHLQPGSVRVRAGDRVRVGEVIGRVGNSGQADAPHLHIHLSDRPSILAAEGLPLVFRSFALQGHLPSLAVLVNGQGWRPTGEASARFREMPTENAVVKFPGGRSDCAIPPQK